MSNKLSISTFLGIAAGLVLVGASSADIINVPGDFGTIQAAIDDVGTVAGDEIVVAIGTYTENINFNGKAITVRSTDPTHSAVVLNTIINGGGSGSVVTCNTGERLSGGSNNRAITGSFDRTPAAARSGPARRRCRRR